MALRFDNQTAVVTGASHGFGKDYATFLASLGANIVVNDSFNPVCSASAWYLTLCALC